MSTRVLSYVVFGARGWLGSKLCSLLEAAGQTAVRCDERFTSREQVRAYLKKAKCDRLVCAVGRTHTADCATIDWVEGSDAWPDLVLANQLLPLWLAEAARDWQAPMLYMGTGCIFTYDDAHPCGSGKAFTESDAPNFFGSAYSRVKGVTDTLIGDAPFVLNARIRMPIDAENGPRDFVSQLLSSGRVCSVPNSMTVLHEVLPALLALLHEGSFHGTLNAVNPGVLDHDAVLRVYEEETGVSHAYTRADVPTLGLAAGRSNNELDTRKIQAALALLPHGVRQRFGCPERLSPLQEGLRAAAARRRQRAEVERPMRLLVTGGCGFIGSHLVNACLANPLVDCVVNVDCMDACACEENVDAGTVAASWARYSLVRWDLADDGMEAQLAELMRKHRITHVVHLAAKTHVDASFDGVGALAYTRTNVVGTHRLLEAARRYTDSGDGELVCFLHMSTEEVYGDVPEGHADEAGLLNPANPYAATKAAAEVLVRSYGASFSLPWKTVRCSNVYGANQCREKVIPRFAQLLRAGDKLTLHGDGSARRTFVHASDVVAALMTVLLLGRARSVYNVGGGTEMDVKELAARVLAHAGVPPDGRIEFVPERPSNDCRYAVDDTKLRALGWKPRMEFDAGLTATLEGMGVMAAAPKHWTEDTAVTSYWLG